MARIRFRNDEIEIEAPAGITLPKAALEAGASIPFGCRAGTCGACVCTVVEGAEYTELGFVEDDTLHVLGHAGPGRRLACQIIVKQGDLEISW